MDNRNSYFISGLFFCVVLAAFAAFLLVMGRGDKNQRFDEYIALTPELPSGIKSGVAVKFIGVDVGFVSDVRFAGGRLDVIEIVLKVREGIPIRPGSSASVESNVITGISVININNDGAGEFADGQVRSVRLEKSLFTRIGSNFGDISERISHSLARLENYMSDERLARLDAILINTEQITANLARTDFAGLVAGWKRADVAGLVGELKRRTARGEFDFKTFLNQPLADISEAMIKVQEAVDVFGATMIRLENNPYEFFFKDTRK